jgi:hypothetical protein
MIFLNFKTQKEEKLKNQLSEGNKESDYKQFLLEELEVPI